jgi:hypothetical protein
MTRRLAIACAAVFGSRLIVLAGGLVGTGFARQEGWHAFDPAGISIHLGRIGNALAATVVRWDAIHYLNIARHGYARGGDTVFLPMLPALVRVGGAVLGSDVVAGALISLAALVIAMVLLHRLAERELGPRAADATVLLMCFAPLSVFLSALYTESLFLAFSAGCLLALREERWALAGAAAAAASVTRVTGVLLVVPFALALAGARHRRRGDLAWLFAAPATVVAFLVYLHARGFGWFAPVAGQGGEAHGHRFTGPVDSLLSAWRAAASGVGAVLRGSDPVLAPSLGGPLSLSAESVVLLGVLLLALWALWAAARRLPAPLVAYAAVALLVCVSSPVSGQPLISLDRYVLTIAPLWMVAGEAVSRRRLTVPVTTLGAGLAGFYAAALATWSFVA